MLAFTLFDTCVGWMGIVGSPYGLRNVVLPQKSVEAVLARIMASGCDVGDHHHVRFGDLPERFRRYWQGEAIAFADKIDLSGATGFEQRVWQAVQSIRYGETRSYKWVALKIGCPQASRAVGQTLAKNPLPIVVPCHRVIASNGNLGGFSGGAEMKKYLLHLEHACLSQQSCQSNSSCFDMCC